MKKTWVSAIMAAFWGAGIGAVGLASGAVLEPSQWVTRAIETERVQYGTFESEAVGETVSYHIYLPAAYHGVSQERFPVLYWLHGGRGGLPGIAAVSSFFDKAITDRHIRPMMIVFPVCPPMRMWCDSKDGASPVESMLMNDLIPHIDKTYRTIAAAEGRLVEGWSMGGYGAGRLGFKFPDQFAAVSMLGAGPLQLDFRTGAVSGVRRKDVFQTTYGGDWAYFEAQSPWRLAEHFAAGEPTNLVIRQAVGLDDAMCADNRAFHKHLDTLKIPHTYLEVPDVSHNTMDVLNALGASNWAFYNAVFGRAAATTEDAADNSDEKDQK